MTQAFKALSIIGTIKLKLNKSHDAFMAEQMVAENHTYSHILSSISHQQFKQLFIIFRINVSSNTSDRL
jgi:hypothetical protein